MTSHIIIGCLSILSDLVAKMASVGWRCLVYQMSMQKINPSIASSYYDVISICCASCTYNRPLLTVSPASFTWATPRPPFPSSSWKWFVFFYVHLFQTTVLICNSLFFFFFPLCTKMPSLQTDGSKLCREATRRSLISISHHPGSDVRTLASDQI